jgi:hypothetical protein
MMIDDRLEKAVLEVTLPSPVLSVRCVLLFYIQLGQTVESRVADLHHLSSADLDPDPKPIFFFHFSVVPYLTFPTDAGNNRIHMGPSESGSQNPCGKEG